MQRKLALVLSLLVSAASAVAFVGFWRLFITTRTGQNLDNAALKGAGRHSDDLWNLVSPTLNVISVPAVVIAIGVVAAIALLRKNVALAVQATVLLAGSMLSAQLIKHVLVSRPDFFGDSGSNSFPSGHTTAAASVCMALVLVLPRRGRAWAAAPLAAYAAVAGIATLIGGWHRPSDIIGALLLCMFFAGLAVAAAATGRGDSGGSTSKNTAWIITSLTTLVLMGGALYAGQAAYDRLWPLRTLTSHATRTQEYTAYSGSAYAVLCVTACLFALLLILRQMAGGGAMTKDPQRRRRS